MSKTKGLENKATQKNVDLRDIEKKTIQPCMFSLETDSDTAVWKKYLWRESENGI